MANFTLNNLGILHCVNRQHAQAEPLLTRALAIKEELLPSIIRHGVELRESPPVARGPWAAGESGTAVPSNLGDSRVGALGPFHPEVEKTPEDLTNALRELGRADEAVSPELCVKNLRAKRS